MHEIDTLICIVCVDSIADGYIRGLGGLGDSPGDSPGDSSTC